MTIWPPSRLRFRPQWQRVPAARHSIHSPIAGPKARQSREIDENKLHDAWETLDQCWKDFDGLRHLGTDGFVQAADIERFVDGWQIFIFECHNVVREALKQRLVARPTPEAPFLPEAQPAGRTRDFETISRLHAKAGAKCQTIVRHVVQILRRNLGTHFFQFDAAFIRDGCFFAGFLLAGEGGNTEDIETCLQALREIRWTFSKCDEREQTVRMIWESRTSQGRSRSFTNGPHEDSLRPPITDYPYARRPLARPISVPPLSLSLSTVSLAGPSSAPSTACSNDPWPLSTPPSSSGTGMYEESVSSDRASPTSPFSHNAPDGLSLDSLHHKAALVSNPSMSFEGASHARGAESGLDVFYWQAYPHYGSSGEMQGSQHVSSTGLLHGAADSDYTSAHYFDASTVVFPNSVIGQQNHASNELASTSGIGGDTRHFGNNPSIYP